MTSSHRPLSGDADQSGHKRCILGRIARGIVKAHAGDIKAQDTGEMLDRVGFRRGFPYITAATAEHNAGRGIASGQVSRSHNALRPRPR